jgi:hydrogenase nickel incorporation protein HypB
MARLREARRGPNDDGRERPSVFQPASLAILNKCDLLPYVLFDAERFERITRQVDTGARLIRVSARRGDNLEEWYD